MSSRCVRLRAVATVGCLLLRGLCFADGAAAAGSVGEVAALLGRISPDYDLAAAVDLHIAGVQGDEGFFEISAPEADSAFAAKITASNAVDLASGVHWWLKYHLNCSVSWWGDQFDVLPKPGTPLPALPASFPTERHSTSYNFRYYMNVCTFGYSTAFWDWQRWEREIDWMALNGINMPLAFVGQEFVFRQVLREVGRLSDAEIESFSAVLPCLRGCGWAICKAGWASFLMRGLTPITTSRIKFSLGCDASV